MSEVNEHEWELNRENIRPLRGGRSVRAMNAVFAGSARVSIDEAEAKFAREFKEAESYDDPLAVCVAYVSWFEEHFPTGKQSHFYPILARIVNGLGAKEMYRNDERMLKMWLKLAENASGGPSAAALLERAFTADCCTKLAKFYVRWAEVREDIGDADGARAVFRWARERGAEPRSLIDEASEAFEMRQTRLLMEQGSDDDGDFDDYDDDDEKRRAYGGTSARFADGHGDRITFGRLEGIGRRLEAPVLRETLEPAPGIAAAASTNYTSSGCAKSNRARAFEIFQDDGEDEAAATVPMSAAELVPKDFGDNLARISLTENSREPGKWKEARIEGRRRLPAVEPVGFQVLDETLFKKRLREKKELQRAKTRLMVADEKTSVEELLLMSRSG